MAMVYMWYAEWGNGGRLWGTVQPLRVFNGLVDGLAVIPVLLRGAFAADVAARQEVELAVVAHLVDEQAQGEVNGVRP